MWRSCLIPKPFPIPSSSRTLKWHLETLEADRFMTTPEQLFCNWKKKSPCSNSKLLSFFDLCWLWKAGERLAEKKRRGELYPLLCFRSLCLLVSNNILRLLPLHVQPQLFLACHIAFPLRAFCNNFLLTWSFRVYLVSKTKIFTHHIWENFICLKY